MQQISLFDAETRIIAPRASGERQSIDERFHAFHAANPVVYTALVILARGAVERGQSKIGIKALWERARWELNLVSQGNEGRRLNNDLTASYARLIMRQERDLAGVFETRERRSEKRSTVGSIA